VISLSNKNSNASSYSAPASQSLTVGNTTTVLDATKHDERILTTQSAENGEELNNVNSESLSPSGDDLHLASTHRVDHYPNDAASNMEHNMPSSFLTSHQTSSHMGTEERSSEATFGSPKTPTTAPFSPDSIEAETGLMVVMQEQELICKTVEEVEMAKNSYEELFNESIDESAPTPFYKSVPPLPLPASASASLTSKQRHCMHDTRE
jgi:hypothetical protein